MTPQDLDPAIRPVLAHLSVTPAEVVEWEPLTTGTYNALWRLTLRDGRRWIWKRPPAPTEKATLRYEHNLLHGETTYYHAVHTLPDVPVPHLLHVHHQGDPPAVAGLLMTERPGTPWHTVDPSLTAAERTRLRHHLGCLVARVHTLTGPHFGYPAHPFGPPADTWTGTFTTMVDAVLDDAARYRVELPWPVDRLRHLLADAQDVLDEVTRPAPVHFDLWPGNLLLDGPPGARHLSGLIDAERMFWGDPAADFVSLALFDDIEHDEAFLTGYAEQDGPVTLTDATRLRLHLYRCYLYLIMLVEVVPRRYSPQQQAWTRRRAGSALTASCQALTSALAG